MKAVQRKIAAVFTALWILFSGCWWGGSDDTWVTHKGGTVCKGANASAVAGEQVYVAPGGSDTNTGISPDQPFATLAQALCNAAPGQTVHIAPGTYNESILLSEFGSASKPITITGEKDGDDNYPVLDGQGSLTYGIAIIGEDTEHRSAGFIIENLTFKNYTDAGILAVISDEITLRNCLLADNGFRGINPDNAGEGFGADLIEVNGLVVSNVEARGNGPEESVWKRGVLGNDISVWGCADVEVSGCYMHDSMGGGLLIEDCVNVLAENNRMENSELDANGRYWDGAIWLDGGHDVIVRNNIVNNNNGPGILITDESVQYPDASYGYVVNNNTITNNRWGISIWNFGVCDWPDTSIISAANNIFSGNVEGDHKCSEWECGEGLPCD